MSKEFPGSRDLAVILKWHGWALYDVTSILSREGGFLWGELEAIGEAACYRVGHRYYLLPSQSEDESLQQRYGAMRGAQIYPVLRIPKKPSDLEKRLGITSEGGLPEKYFVDHFLNEFHFSEKNLITSSSVFFAYKYLSRVTLPAASVVNAFSYYFCQMQFTDKGLFIKKPAKDAAEIN